MANFTICGGGGVEAATAMARKVLFDGRKGLEVVSGKMNRQRNFPWWFPYLWQSVRLGHAFWVETELLAGSTYRNMQRDCRKNMICNGHPGYKF